MTFDQRLDSLLLRWEELAEGGQLVSAAELCQDCPELIEPLQQRINALRELGWLVNLVGRPSSGSARSSERPLRPGGGRDTVATPGQEPVPGYRLVRRLGRGGFGEVWEAEGPDAALVAIKLIPRQEMAALVEARALDLIKDLRHPNLLPVFGTWQTEEFLVIVMERAERSLLDRWQEAQGQGLPGIPRDELLDYFRQAAQGIDFLNEPRHRQNGQSGLVIQHRDIKPQNLLLVGGRVKVADFGLARLVVHSFTGHTGSLTLAFAAPEFFEGRTTRHSDQYSLAVTWCLLRGGRVPFPGSFAQTVAGHLYRAPDLTMLSEEERPAVARALAKRPVQRWPNCAAFVEALANPRLLPSRRRWVKVAVGAAAAAGVLPLWYYLHQPAPVGSDTETEEEGIRPVATFRPPDGYAPIRSAAFSLTSNRILTNGATGPLQWDRNTGQIVRRFAAGLAGVGIACGEPNFGPLVVTGREDGVVVLWNEGAGEWLRNYPGHTKSVTSVAFSRDSNRILSGACDETVRYWKRDTGEQLCFCEGHEAIVMAVAALPDSRHGISVSQDGTLRLWNLETGVEQNRFDVSAQPLLVMSLSYDGTTVLIGGAGGVAELWDLKAGQRARVLEGHAEKVTAVALSRDGRRGLTWDTSQTMRVWDMASGRQTHALWTGAESAECLVISPDGEIALSAHNTLRLWRLPP